MTSGAHAPPSQKSPSARLLLPVTPIADESISSLVVRAADANSLRTSEILHQVGATHVKSIEPLHHVETLAPCLGVPDAEIARRVISRSSERPDFVRYFGDAFRATFFNFSRYAYSPRALEKSPHHRVRWHIAAFPYCTETWSELRHTCSSCERRLAWFGRDSLIRCSSCGHDLRSAPAIPIAAGLQTELALLSQLLSNDPDERRKATAAFPKSFHAVSPSGIFSVVVLFAHAQTDIPVSRYGANQGLKAEHLARGCDIALRFPSSFKQIANSRSLDHHTISSFFVKVTSPEALLGEPLAKEIVLEAVSRLEPVRHGPSRLRLRREAEGHLTTTSAARMLRIDNADTARLLEAGHLTASRAFGGLRQYRSIDPKAVETLANRFVDRISATELEGALAVPREAIEQLVAVGLLATIDDPAVQLVFPGLQLRRSSSQTLMEDLKRILVDRGDRRMVSLRDAFCAIGNQQKPWAAIILAALDGRLPDPLGVDSDEGLRLDDVLISDGLARDLASGNHPELLAVPTLAQQADEPPLLNRQEVERYLNCFPRDVSWLVANQELRPQSDAIRRFCRANVAQLGSMLISSREISWRWRVSPAFRERLESELGITRSCGPFWRRSEVLNYFERRFPRGRPVD